MPATALQHFDEDIARARTILGMDKGGAVLTVIQDIDYLVHRCDEHIHSEFREFLAGVGCSAAMIAQAGY